jgi:hypothetical protein
VDKLIRRIVDIYTLLNLAFTTNTKLFKTIYSSLIDLTIELRDML